MAETERAGRAGQAERAEPAERLAARRDRPARRDRGARRTVREDAEPTVWDAMTADPTVPIDPRTTALIVADQQRWSRTWLYPWLRILSRLAVLAILAVKRLVPVPLRAHATMDALCVWFLRRFVSVEAGELLVRHFAVETRLLQFAVRNVGVTGLPDVTLLPTSLRELGDRAVIEHDLNVYDVLVAVGRRSDEQGGLAGCLARRSGPLDSSMLALPEIDAEPGRRRWLRLDIQSALCLMNIPFALCLTSGEYRRAVHSMRLDASLMALLAQVTGDPAFLAWRPAGPVLRVDSTLDAPWAVYQHAVFCEYAYARLVASAGR